MAGASEVWRCCASPLSLVLQGCSGGRSTQRWGSIAMWKFLRAVTSLHVSESWSPLDDGSPCILLPPSYYSSDGWDQWRRRRNCLPCLAQDVDLHMQHRLHQVCEALQQGREPHPVVRLSERSRLMQCFCTSDPLSSELAPSPAYWAIDTRRRNSTNPSYRHRPTAIPVSLSLRER